MKRKLFLIMLLLLTTVGSSAIAMPPASIHTVQKKEKSEIEIFIQKLAKIKSDEINYAYISVGMFRQMFAEIFESDDEEFTVLTSLKYMRQFLSTGENGYALLKKNVSHFLEGDDEVMGLKLMAHNREGDTQSLVYSGSDVILVLSDCGNDELRIVFIAGLGYDSFMKYGIEGLDLFEL